MYLFRCINSSAVDTRSRLILKSTSLQPSILKPHHRWTSRQVSYYIASSHSSSQKVAFLTIVKYMIAIRCSILIETWTNTITSALEGKDGRNHVVGNSQGYLENSPRQASSIEVHCGRSPTVRSHLRISGLRQTRTARLKMIPAPGPESSFSTVFHTPTPVSSLPFFYRDPRLCYVPPV